MIDLMTYIILTIVGMFVLTNAGADILAKISSPDIVNVYKDSFLKFMERNEQWLKLKQAKPIH